MSIISIEDRKKKAWESYTPEMNQKISESDAVYNKQSETLNTLYGNMIDVEKQQYDDLSRENEVQKYINAREVAENNANLGLTDSGLNRTQQTAVQLAASNQEAKIQRARQSAVDTLTNELISKLADVETNKSAAQMSIKSGYEELISNEAIEGYNTDVEAETARLKAEQEAAIELIKLQQEAASKKNTAYSTLVKDLKTNNYDKNTAATLLYTYINEYGYSNEAELNNLLAAAGLTADDYASYLNYGIVRDAALENGIAKNMAVIKAGIEGGPYAASRENHFQTFGYYPKGDGKTAEQKEAERKQQEWNEYIEFLRRIAPGAS